ncbi:FtsX-like permease family protein [Lacisediminihabitans sp. FW035]
MTREARPPRYRLVSILTRQFRSDGTAHIVLAATVLAITALTTALPLVVQSMNSDEIGYRLKQLSAPQRDLGATVPGSVATAAGPGKDGQTEKEIFAPTDAGLARVIADSPEPLRSRMATPQYLSLTAPVSAATPARRSDPALQLTVAVAPGIDTRVRITDGARPAAFGPVAAGGPAIEVMMTAENAAALRWRVGETRSIVVGPERTQPVTLSGIFAPRSAADPYWALDRSALVPEKITVQRGSDIELIQVSTVVIDPASWPNLRDSFSATTTTFRIPLSAAPLATDQADRMLPQVRRFAATAQSIAAEPPAGTETPAGTVTRVRFDTGIDDALAPALDRGRAASAVLLMVAIGPLGVAAAVLWLLVSLIVQRRRETLVLARARGASAVQLAGVLVVETLLLTVPAAAVGAAIAVVANPGPLPSALVVIPLAIALLPGLLIAIAATGRAVRAGRTDLDPRSRPWVRVVLELLVGALTVLAVVLLLQRGLTTSTSIGVDPLLASVPLLLAVTTALIVLRLFPAPLLALGRRLARGRGFVGHLGSLRAVRDPPAGLAPVLAMVVGLSVAVFSGVLVGTVQHGVAAAGESNVGADLRVTGATFTDMTLDRISQVHGVSEVAGIYEPSTRLDAVLDGSRFSVALVVADTRRLARVQGDLENVAVVPPGMSRLSRGAVPGIVFPSYTAATLPGARFSVGGEQIHALGDPATGTALSRADAWLLVDRAVAPRFDTPEFRPELALVRLAPASRSGHGLVAVEKSIRAVVGEGVVFATPAESAAAFRTSPVASGLQLLLVLLIVAVGLLCAGTVVLALLVSARPRERLLALLRTLGLSRRQSRGIVAWEVGPSAVIAIIAGAILGLVLPLVVLAGVDVRSFTGGTTQPRESFDPLVLATLVGGFFVVVAGAALLAITAARRVDIARTLRTSGEG